MIDNWKSKLVDRLHFIYKDRISEKQISKFLKLVADNASNKNNSINE